MYLIRDCARLRILFSVRNTRAFVDAYILTQHDTTGAATYIFDLWQIDMTVQFAGVSMTTRTNHRATVKGVSPPLKPLDYP